MKRVLKVAATTVVVLVLGYGAGVVSAFYKFRDQTVSFPAQPLELREDAAALRFARKALQQIGYDPKQYTPVPFGSDLLCGRNDQNPDFGSFSFEPASDFSKADHPSLYVRLDQHNNTVTCSVARAK